MAPARPGTFRPVGSGSARREGHQEEVSETSRQDPSAPHSEIFVPRQEGPILEAEGPEDLRRERSSPWRESLVVVELRPLGVSRVHTDGRNLYTENLTPGRDVYGERLVTVRGIEYRPWDPRRSKLAALLLKGWKILPLARGSQVLYLGAASGTTVSHVSDLVPEGTVYAVELSRRVFQKLLELAEARHNVLPILADASTPDAYAGTVGRVDLLYQDIAQRDQVEILERNLRFLNPDGTVILIVKSRSIDVAREPARVYHDVESALRKKGLHVLGTVPLDPSQRDHAAVVAEFSHP